MKPCRKIQHSHICEMRKADWFHEEDCIENLAKQISNGGTSSREWSIEESELKKSFRMSCDVFMILDNDLWPYLEPSCHLRGDHDVLPVEKQPAILYVIWRNRDLLLWLPMLLELPCVLSAVVRQDGHLMATLQRVWKPVKSCPG